MLQMLNGTKIIHKLKSTEGDITTNKKELVYIVETFYRELYLKREKLIATFSKPTLVIHTRDYYI